MKITHNKVGQNLNLIDNQKTEKSEKSDKTGKSARLSSESILGSSLSESSDLGAKVSLSQRAQDIKNIKANIGSLDEVDEAKVAKFQALIDQGKYAVDAEAVADKMVDEHFMMS
jgi:negative regulator of flagellin synthesis FlgM